MPIVFPFKNSYAQLPAHFYAIEQPTPVKEPQLIRFNKALATELGIEFEQASDDELAQLFAGNQLPDNAKPLAMAYAGHQFGHLNPQLGDGRAILLGDLETATGGLRDIQLKGAGMTAFSRGGDGRSPLGPALREYIMCEAMAALGVPTTRALAVVSSGEKVVRERLEPGAIFTRVAASHIRVGTFQYFALKKDAEAIQTLANHVLARHYPDIDQNSPDCYLELLESICKRQAELIAKWMSIGFIHGVMNTDNMTVSGETIDYGPCAFMDTYRAKTVYSYIDRQGRYAYQNQPAIGQWNLARLAETLLSFIPDRGELGEEGNPAARATRVLQQYSQWFQKAWQQNMNYKLGLSTVEEGDDALIDDLLTLLEQAQIDFTQFFRDIISLVPPTTNPNGLLATNNSPQLSEWIARWQQLLKNREQDLAAAVNLMKAVNPVIIPRNHRVAEAIKAAEDGDFTHFERLLSALEKPFEERPEFSDLEKPPQPNEEISNTFCGT